MNLKRYLWALLALFIALPGTQQAQSPEKDPFDIPVLTLSKGKYEEFHDQDTVVKIGRVLFNVHTGHIVGFIEQDTLHGDDAFQADIATRWLSPDPLAEEFPSWSPFTYVEDNPIVLIDPDGRAARLPDGPGYHQSHPVSRAIIGYDPNIWRAFHGSNNTSTMHFHNHSKGLGGADARGKAIGAIGEGLFATRLTSTVTETGSDLFIGYTINGLHHDLYQRTNLLNTKAGRFELKVNHTNTSGVKQSSKVEVARDMLVSNGKISYEVKTLSPNNSPSIILDQFKKGVEQVKERIGTADAGVLVFDKGAWDAVYSSPQCSDLMKAYKELSNLKNDHGNQVGFLRLEENLHSDSIKSYHALKNKVKDL